MDGRPFRVRHHVWEDTVVHLVAQCEEGAELVAPSGDSACGVTYTPSSVNRSATDASPPRVEPQPVLGHQALALAMISRSSTVSGRSPTSEEVTIPHGVKRTGRLRKPRTVWRSQSGS